MVSSFRLHSIHNPEREADRFIDSSITIEAPVFIVVSEPGESWIAKSVQKKFPSAIRIALRYSNSLFLDTDTLWNHVWRPDSLYSVSSFLFNIIPDEYLSLTQFISWKPSDSIWHEESFFVWNEISQLIKKQQSIMYTRTHFGTRWLKNIFKNCVHLNSTMTAEYTKKPVLLAAAGPSLEQLFPFNVSDMYVCAVSSALSCLSYNKCTPDICISTDGGYWALDHFRNLTANIPVAFPLEAAIPTSILLNNPLVLLDYGSALESLLFKALHITAEKASRNGTVAGTAALYALAHSTSTVFASGLDLCESLNFPHARPHSTDLISISHNRLNSFSTLLYERNISTDSFKMYSDWFSSRDENFKSRFFRIKPVPSFIDGIQNIEKEKIQKSVHDTCENSRSLKLTKHCFNLQKRKKILLSILDSILLECRVLKNPAYFISVTDLQIKESKNDICSATLEFLQMVSYLDYINALKAVRNPKSLHNKDISQPINTLCDLAESFIIKLMVLIESQK